jgi:light-independent protochlorophyllide reductase subunit B
VQDFPARYSPQMGFEGANVLFDTWVHPLMMGLEEHLIGMFRGDFEFHEDAAPSHLGGHGKRTAAVENAEPIAVETEPAVVAQAATVAANDNGEGAPAAIPAQWAPDAEKELRKIPFFVRGKARRNTEAYAHDHRVPVITIETLYDAKAHFSR